MKKHDFIIYEDCGSVFIVPVSDDCYFFIKHNADRGQDSSNIKLNEYYVKKMFPDYSEEIANMVKKIQLAWQQDYKIYYKLQDEFSKKISELFYAQLLALKMLNKVEVDLKGRMK